MKKALIIFLLLFSVSLVWAQKAPPKKRAVVGRKATVNMYHNFHDLEKMRKSSLKSLYIRRILAVYEELPFLALNGFNGATVDDLGIPPTKENAKKLAKDLKAKMKYTKTLKKHLNEYLGYAEKEYLIQSIMFVEQMLGHIHDMQHDLDMRIKD